MSQGELNIKEIINILILIGEMSEGLMKFKDSLAHKHYSNAFIQHLVDIITENSSTAPST